MVINEIVHPQMTPETAAAILNALIRREAEPLMDLAAAAAENAGGTAR